MSNNDDTLPQPSPPSNSLSSELEQAVALESRTLEQVSRSLRSQIDVLQERQSIESERAQSLTSQLVAARRDEDKAMLASDEAVSHALRDKGKEDLEVLKKILDKPYFARMVIQEELGAERATPNRSGQTAVKEIEYKLGTNANPECRIVDWRRAPISKLYYEYKEGEEFSEEIMGRERNGRVVLRTSVDIHKGVLRRVNCRHGTAIKRLLPSSTAGVSDAWVQIAERSESRREVESGALGKILPFISADQFRLITEGATTAVMIQGVAGSGKSAVALHRLAWLLHEDNSDLSAEGVVILAITLPLKRYLERAVSDLGLPPLPVLTISDWSAFTIAKVFPNLICDWDEAKVTGTIKRPTTPTPSSHVRLKQSVALLKVLENRAKASGTAINPSVIQDIYLSVLSKPETILEHDESRLLNRDLIKEVYTRTADNFRNNTLERFDEALLVRAIQIISAQSVVPKFTPDQRSAIQSEYGLYQHIVVDEVQELTPAELAVVISSVERVSGLTLVGDIQQATSTTAFPGWEKLKMAWSDSQNEDSPAISKLVSLDISHRSTAEIMAVARHIQGQQYSSLRAGERRGRAPLVFACRSESNAVASSIKWLSTATERYPDSISSVLCLDMSEARQVYSLLKPSLGSAVRLWEGSSCSFEQGIVVTDISQVKGLEFTNALIWNPTEKRYPADEQMNRNLLYVAVTRAEENLALVVWNTISKALPFRNSPLVRWYDVAD